MGAILGSFWIDLFLRVGLLILTTCLYMVGHPSNSAYSFFQKYADSGSYDAKILIRKLQENKRVDQGVNGFLNLAKLSRYYKPKEVTRIELRDGFVYLYGEKGFITSRDLLDEMSNKNEENLQQALVHTSERIWKWQLLLATLLIMTGFFQKFKKTL